MDVFVSRKIPTLTFIRINPGDWVVIKPNLIKECKENDPSEWRSVITSPEIIEAVCRDVCRKLQKKGKVTICDAPQTDSSFQKIAERLGLFNIAARCSEEFDIPVEVLDLRNEEWTNENGVITDRRRLPGDPNGSISFNLGRNSFFYGHKGEGHYYGADYDARVVNSHHHGETHEYLICATPIKADVFINIAKMKTHKKTGVTLSLKNLVGINADKNWLPHHTEGSLNDGGDQFPRLGFKQGLERKAVGLARGVALKMPGIGPKISQRLRSAGAIAFGGGNRVIRSGNWYGNDTTWRMVLDLNRCLLYGNPDGTFRSINPKRYYCLVDGMIGMEGAGPMQGDAITSNVVIGGTDPVAVDMVAARVMGFDWRKIPVIREAFNQCFMSITYAKPAEVIVHSEIQNWAGLFDDIKDNKFLQFKPHFGWQGHIEY